MSSTGRARLVYAGRANPIGDESEGEGQVSNAPQDRATWLLEQVNQAGRHPRKLVSGVQAIVELYRDAKDAERTYEQMELPSSAGRRGDREQEYARGAVFAYSRVIEELRDAFATGCDAISLHAWDAEGDEDRRAGRFGQEFDRQSTVGRDRVEMRMSEVTASPVYVVLWSGDTAVSWMEPMWLGRPGADALTVNGPFEATAHDRDGGSGGGGQ